MYPPPPDAHTVDTVFAIIAVAALVIGLISMSVGRVVEWWDEGLQKARGVNDYEDDITSSNLQEPARTSSEPPANQTGSADTSAARTSTGGDRSPALPSLHNHLSRLELLTLLAVQKDDDGEYLYSANKIADLVGGARQKTLDQINEARGLKKDEPPRANNRLSRPENGWH